MSTTPDPIDKISDFYIPLRDPLNGWFNSDDGVIDFQDTPQIYDYVKRLAEKSESLSTDYLDFVVHEGVHSYRGHLIRDAIETNSEGQISGPIVTLRKIAKRVPDLEKIGLDNGIVEILGHPWLNRGGIIVIAGETGNGKSTTCSATILHRIKKYGTFALTIEDPPELPLHGRHGKGRCIQTEAKEGQFASAMRGAMRSYPSTSGNILYVGETRDPETAVELLRAANNGHLVITTTHANDIPAIVKRLSTLASASLPVDEVNDNLGANIRLIMHQTLKRVKLGEGMAPKVILNAKFLLSYGASSPVAQYIARGKAEHLGTELEHQRNLLSMQGVDALFAAQNMRAGSGQQGF